MAKADIQIELRGGEVEGGLMRFEPGASLQGTLQVTPEGDIRCNHLYVRLQWRTEGRGDRDEQRVAEVDVFQGTLQAGMPSSDGFHFTLPREPWSYAGHYINIIWEIAVIFSIPLSPDLRYHQPFILAPRRGP